MMKIYEFKTEQLLKANIEIIWNFFSNPKNLNDITPSSLQFQITSEASLKMYEGQIISYKIKLLPLIKQTWITEIKSVKEKKCFVDEQRFGPYKFWHHKHIFEETNNGVLMTDLVHYIMPFGFLGIIARNLFVKNMLNSIFSFRHKYLEKKFNNPKVS